MKTKENIQTILDKIQYKDWKFRLLEKGDGFLIQATFIAEDIHSKIIEEQFCRKFYVSSHSCDNEIVRTVYLAVQQAEMHELDENFKYLGKAIFDPHLNMERLAQSIDDIGIEAREPKTIT